jgi:hypothetical protein
LLVGIRQGHTWILDKFKMLENERLALPKEEFGLGKESMIMKVFNPI